VIALLAAVLGASVVGSLHCAVMCGPLQALYLDPAMSRIDRWRGPALHALGRLGAYVTLGAVAGGVGAAVDLGAALVNVQRAAMIIAGTALIAWGVLALASALGVKLPSWKPRLWKKGLVQIRKRKPGTRAVLVGLLSGALPCGWLWAFVVVAGGTGGVVTGALVMMTFWLGTVPMMVGLGAFAGPAVRTLGARLPVVTAAVLVAIGVIALRARVPMLHVPVHERATAGDVPTEPACHGDLP
jgi:sulfite exporter TauE/SafE